MISQFFVLSLRGDTIISRDYTSDVHKVKTSAEVFFDKVRRWGDHGDHGQGHGEEAPPVLCVDGVQYLYVKTGGLFLVATTRRNVSPALVLELLNRVASIVKDYCGVLTEESVRQNFVLLYELLDEIVDYGVPQNTSTDVLKRYVLNAPVLPSQLPTKASILAKRDGKAPVISKSVVQRGRDGKKGEIFVDIVERLSVTFNASGYVQNSAIDGSIQVKCYLSGNPLVKVALNEDLQIAGRDSMAQHSFGSNYGVLLDDCNFYEDANLDNFDIDRTISLNPTQGEFSLMNYRTTREARPPFRVTTSLEDTAPFKVELVMKVRADYPTKITASMLSLSVPVPKSTLSVSFPSGAKGTFSEKERKLSWSLRKVQGGAEHVLVARISLNNQANVSIKKEFGPVSLNFSLPMFNSSKLQVKYLQILDQSYEKGQNPSRWVRYITESGSYICRM